MFDTGSTAPTGQTAIVIVPPPDIRGFADHYRQKYAAEQIWRIEAHITVDYPFVPFDRIEEAEERLRLLFAKCPPRAVAIRGFGIFPEDKVLYLRLAKPERVTSLYEAVLAEFPQYPAYGRQPEEFVPHMTVGLFSDAEELERVYSELAPLRLFIAWDVESVYLIYKTADGTWHPWAEIPLGEG
ncbi:MAG TPA: 2'-5' RNA ligase family protein [Chloroflexia bacterium]|jgi:2'-5' RNA ligase